jgi:hypothetical protein
MTIAWSTLDSLDHQQYSTLLAADKPLIMARNWLRLSTADAKWNTAGTWAAADGSDADGPATYGFDDFDHLQTYPDDAAPPNTVYYVMNLGAESGEVDSVALKNHNLNSEGVTVAVEFDGTAGPTGTFGTTHTAASSTPSSDKRVVFLDLHHTGSVPLRYTSVQYLRLKCTGTTITPKIGEVIISRRRQLKHKALLPWDKSSKISNVGRFDTAGGIDHSYTFHKNRRILRGTLKAHEDDFIDDLDAFYETDTDGGTLPFLWIEDPNTDASDAHWVKLVNPDLIYPLSGWTERNFQLHAREMGPNFLAAGT